MPAAAVVRFGNCTEPEANYSLRVAGSMTALLTNWSKPDCLVKISDLIVSTGFDATSFIHLEKCVHLL